ncbi:MAG TPA: isoaspartyl peptidase/L-asparaginase [Chitinophagaceae bacterium]|nr:isoaspartyl peptidase/L-asparaginase [Chitinophagaceae bacterium]
MPGYSIAIHGGAGTIQRSAMTADMEAAYTRGLEEALDAGYAILKGGGHAVDAVRAAVVSLEDNILFNAGRGAVFARDGSQEMDAAIMDGHTGQAGAVCGVKRIKNPVELSYAVMMQSPHVMLSGPGANEFAAAIGMKEEPDSYFFSKLRYDQWQQVKETDTAALDHNIVIQDKKFGTVGAVACDARGHLAAATSTGGMTNKQWGRVGDSPVIGSGTYANDKTCAISCTGHGELFIKAVAAYDVSCLMEYKGLSLQEAMQVVVMDKLVKINGEGGMIGADAQGNIAMLFNSEGMYRGMMDKEGRRLTAIYK